MDYTWLLGRPIAHRGLHGGDKIENTHSAFAAAIKNNYAIECDLQITKDGEAVVFHDDEIDRLLEGQGRVKNFTAKELKSLPFKSGKDRMQTLADLLDQVNGKSTLVIELKSLWDNDQTLTHRALEVIASYKGPYAFMSFDPDIVACLAEHSPKTVRGITADRATDSYYDFLSPERRSELQTFSHLPKTRPHFVSFDFKDLPFPPVAKLRAAGHPVITWTIKSTKDAAEALRNCDQITFEGFDPA
jgi:glycerophosphoryl diester phosphodiesterase